MQKIIQKIIHKIVEDYAPEEIILFGSHAKQQQHALSDIDLLVVLNTSLPRQGRAREIFDFIRQLPMKVDLHVYTPEEISRARRNPHSFISSILITGIKIYEKNSCND